jgi:hypothetical protein
MPNDLPPWEIVSQQASITPFDPKLKFAVELPGIAKPKRLL